MTTSKRNSKGIALAVLKALARLIATLNNEDLEALASGTAVLKVSRLETTTKQAGLGLDDAERGNFNFERLQNDLNAVESTKAGFAILDDAQLTRTELERLARSLDLPITRQDGIDRIEEKIVEALIGSRLNSRAIRGR